MADQRVEQITTPVSEAELTRALLDAVKELYGINLSKSQVAILVAQNNLETDHRKSMHNFNIGNITHVKGDGWDYFAGGDRTRDANGNWKPTTLSFRAYPNLATAAKDYVKNIHNRNGGRSWQKIMEEDIPGFSSELKKSKYYEADEKDYTNALLAKSKAFKNQNSYEKANDVKTNDLKPTDKGADMLAKLDSYLNKFLSSIASSNKTYVKISSVDLVDSIEFARILSLALEEEFNVKSNIYTDGSNVEVCCASTSSDALSKFCEILQSSFKKATASVGGIDIKSDISLNSNNYQELDIKLAQSAYRKFHYKFIKG